MSKTGMQMVRRGDSYPATTTMAQALAKAQADNVIEVQATTVPRPSSSLSPEMQLELERLRAENAALKAKVQSGQGKLTLKVSDKGALSVYGMGRFPVTLYREQWERLLAEAERIQDFIRDHASALKLKGQD